MGMEYDVIVIGAGIAGLMTAVRLASSGRRVAVVEEGGIAAGATGKNHGIIHSGSLYADLHPDLVPLCQEACTLFASHFSGAIVNHNSTLHLIPPDEEPRCRERLRALGVGCGAPLPASARAMFRESVLDQLALLGVDSLTVSSTRVCASLAQMAVDAGAEMLTRTAVDRVLLDGGSARGVLVSPSVRIEAGRVVLCSGGGMPGILARSGLSTDRFRTRADLMLVVPGVIDHPVVEYRFGGSYVVPALGGSVLASRFGGTQPFIDSVDSRVNVPLTIGVQLMASLRRLFRPHVLRGEHATAYTCSKIELRSDRADAWGVEPYHNVIDHAETDGVRDLWSLLPGKMTLAFHATSDLCARLRGAPEPLGLPTSGVEPSPRILAMTALAPTDGVAGSAWAGLNAL